MDRSIGDLRDGAPSLILMGMRGAGKTTLGRLAAEHLDTQFIDADELFTTRHATPKTFVAEHGWPAFRRAETAILRELLASMRDPSRKKPLVVSLGGGVVEEEVNRALLKQSWMGDGHLSGLDRRKKVAVVHVFREVDKVLLDRRGMPSWGVANGDEVWQRRRPWFRESSSHEFVNFTEGDLLNRASEAESSRAARLRFEAVERDFVRFLAQLLASFDPRAKPWMPSRQARSYLVTLPFADLRPHVEKLPLITLGADAIELRADLLHDPSRDLTASTGKGTKDIVEAYENPSLSYLSEQIALIRRHLPGYPLVFTLRTPAQGGRYPYPADAPSEALFTSLRHALKLGCDVIDIEMGLDVQQSNALLREAKERKITVLISWRDKIASNKGGFEWRSNRAQKLYNEAVQMGADIVKIVGTAGQVSDNFALRVFAAGLEDSKNAAMLPPLSAYNMGYPGRISRFLNPTLASITHRLAKELSKQGVVGNPSMTFEEVQQALHLSGLIEKASFIVVDTEGQDLLVRYRHWFHVMGLPYAINRKPWPIEGLEQILRDNDPRQGDVRGLCFPNGAKIGEIRLGSELILDPFVINSGFFDCVQVENTESNKTPPDTDKDGVAAIGSLHASNTLVEALADLITSSISPSVHLSRQSICVILTPSGQEEHCMLQVSAAQAATLVGLVNIARQPADTPWEEGGGTPTIIINCCPTAPLHESLLAGQDGGLYVDMLDNQAALAIVQQQCYTAIGWRCIDTASVWRHVDALRFRAFTGRRAPSKLADHEPLPDT